MGRSRVPQPIRDLLAIPLNRLAISGTNIRTGQNFRAGRGVIISAPHSLSIGHHCSVGPRSVIQVDGKIGHFVMIGMNVHIVGRNDHAIDEVGVPMLYSTWSADRPQAAGDSVDVGNDVWIGASAVVLSGVAIGTGAVVGAGAVVTKDLPPFSINVGSPARTIGERFSEVRHREEHIARIDALVRTIDGGAK